MMLRLEHTLSYLHVPANFARFAFQNSMQRTGLLQYL